MSLAIVLQNLTTRIGTEFKASQFVIDLASGSEHHHRDGACPRIRPESLVDLEAVDTWEHDVENDQVRLNFEGLGQHIDAVKESETLVSLSLQMEGN